MRARSPAVLAAAILLTGGLVAWLISRIGGDAPPGTAAPPIEALPAPAVPAPAVAPLLAPPEPTDAELLRRRAELDDARARYRALRDAFGAGRPETNAQARLDPALRTLAKAGSVRWKVACRGLVCRVDAPGADGAWHAALRESEAVRYVIDRIDVDPDGAESAAYLLLTEGGSAEDGDGVLALVAQRFQDSAATRKCLAESTEKGAAEYELNVDSTGLTYRFGGNLPWPVVQCLNLALTEVMTATPVPPTVKSAARTVALRTP